MHESLCRRTSIGSNDLPRSKCNDTFPLEHSPDLSYRCIELFFAKAELQTCVTSANRDLWVYRKRLFFNSLVIYFFISHLRNISYSIFWINTNKFLFSFIYIYLFLFKYDLKLSFFFQILIIKQYSFYIIPPNLF